jgi:hypothetical protein
MDAAQLGRGSCSQRVHSGGVGVAASAEADSAQDGVGWRRDVQALQRQDGLRRLDRDAVRPREPRRERPVGQLLLTRRERGADADVRDGQAEIGSRPAPDRSQGTDDRGLRRLDDAVLRQVDAQHREAEERRFEHRLLVEPREAGRRLEEDLLRAEERAADGDRLGLSGGPRDPELTRELRIDPLAVGDEIRVAVLVARAGDERCALAGEGLCPVERLGDRSGVAVHDVVAGVAPRAEHDRVLEVHRRVRKLRREDVRPVVGGEGVVRAEVPGEEDEIVAGPEELAAKVGRRPAVIPVRRRADRRDARRHGLVRDQGVVVRAADAGLQVPGDDVGRIGEEVVPRRERRGRRGHRAARSGEVGIEHPFDLGGRLDEPSDRKVRNRERVRVD